MASNQGIVKVARVVDPPHPQSMGQPPPATSPGNIRVRRVCTKLDADDDDEEEHHCSDPAARPPNESIPEDLGQGIPRRRGVDVGIGTQDVQIVLLRA